MKKYYKGKYIEMTAEEIEALKVDIPTEKEKSSLEERLSVIEQGFAKLEKLFSSFKA